MPELLDFYVETILRVALGELETTRTYTHPRTHEAAYVLPTANLPIVLVSGFCLPSVCIPVIVNG